MAAERYTIRSSASSEIHDATSPGLELELPNGEGFDSLPPRVSLAEMIERSRQLRCWFPTGLRRAEERWQAKTDVEFHL
jgi:hypothetical protein